MHGFRRDIFNGSHDQRLSVSQIGNIWTHDAFFSKGKIKARLFKCATGRDIPLMSPNVITVKENLPFFLFMSITTTYYTIP